MNAKALARFLYAKVPGLAAMRFAAKDLTARFASKPEYKGVLELSVGTGLIVDVGANRGQSVRAFKRFAPKSRIVAFEPEPKSVGLLKVHHRRDPDVIIHSCALGARPGALTFFVPKYGNWDCDGMAATDFRAATEWLRDPHRMLFFDESKLSVKDCTVECRTLDSYELAPCLIKLHAQGAEYDILLGATFTIAQHQPALMVAFVSDDVDKLLAGCQYQPYDYRSGRFTPGVAAQPRTFTWYLTRDHVHRLS
jgi:FkbM family methyltransferase